MGTNSRSNIVSQITRAIGAWFDPGDARYLGQTTCAIPGEVQSTSWLPPSEVTNQMGGMNLIGYCAGSGGPWVWWRRDRSATSGEVAG